MADPDDINETTHHVDVAVDIDADALADAPGDESPDDHADPVTDMARIARAWAGVNLGGGVESHATVRRSDGDSELALSMRQAIDGAGLDQPQDRPEYQLIERIGAGGMGVVWRAQQTSLLREVAFKRSTSAATDQRFLAEAVISARLEHPHILPVYSLARDPDGRMALAMKLVDGISWRQLLHPETDAQRERAKRTRREDHLRILIAVCNAVAYAHSKRVLHRDIKPANIMVGAFGEVWLCDWGLAILLDEQGRVTLPMSTGGSPAYMPSEMATGRSADISPRSDVYLLGATLFEVLHGTPPHHADSAMQALWKAAAGEHPALSDDIPSELADICTRAISQHPEQRQESAVALRSELEQYLDHRESFRIAAMGATALNAALRQQGAAGYPGFAAALNHYTQAFILWSGNQAASDGLLTAKLRYAGAAYDNGDHALCSSLLDGVDEPEAKELYAAAKAQLDFSARRARVIRILRFSVVGALLLGLVGVAVSGFLIAAQERRALSAESQRLEAEQRSRAADERRLFIEQQAAATARRRAEAFVPYAKAADLVARGQRPDHAITLAKQALTLDTDFIEAAHILGESYRLNGEPSNAVAAYLRADEISRRVSASPALPSLLAAGICADSAGDYRHADELFGIAAQASSNEPLAHVGTTFRSFYWERVAEGLAASASAASLGPHLWECRLARGYALMEAAQRGIIDPVEAEPEALRELRAAARLNPRQADIKIWTAMLLTRIDSVTWRNEIEDLYDTAVDLEPTNGARWVQRAMMSGFRPMAQRQRDLVEGERLGANELLLKRVMASLAISRGDRAVATALMARIKTLVPDWPTFSVSNLIYELQNSPDRTLPIALARSWAAAHPNLSISHLLLAQTVDDPQDKLVHYTAGLEFAPWSYDLLTQIVRLHMHLGRFQEAQTNLERLLRFRPLIPELWTLSADIHRALGNTTAERAALQRAAYLRARTPTPRPSEPS